MTFMTKNGLTLLLSLSLSLGCASDPDDPSGSSSTSSTTSSESSSTGEPISPRPDIGAYSDCNRSPCVGEDLLCFAAGWKQRKTCSPTGCTQDSNCPAGPDGQSARCLTYPTYDTAGAEVGSMSLCIIECPGQDTAECPLGMECTEFTESPGHYCM